MIYLSPREFQALIIKHSEAYVQTSWPFGLQRGVTIQGVVYVENAFKEEKA